MGFSTSGKLQSHFVDMHANQGQAEDYDEVEYVEEEVSWHWEDMHGSQASLIRAPWD